MMCEQFIGSLVLIL